MGLLSSKDRRARVIANAELELPLDGPGFGLFVLAAFDEDLVFALLELHGELVLVELGSAMVFISGEDELTVEPDLPAVFAAEADLGLALFARLKLSVRITRDLFEHGVGLVEVDLAVFVGAGEVGPFYLAGLAGVGGGEVDLLFGWEDGVEALALDVREGGDELPTAHETEVRRKIDGAAEVLEFFGEVFDLVFIASAFHGLLEGDQSGVLLALFQRFIASAGEFRHRMAAEFAARIFEQLRGDFLGQLRLRTLDDVKGDDTRRGAVLRVHKEGLHGLDGQLLRLDGLIHDDPDSGTQPVFSEWIGAVHGGEDFRQGGGICLGDLLPGGGSFFIAFTFLLDRT